MVKISIYLNKQVFIIAISSHTANQTSIKFAVLGLYVIPIFLLFKNLLKFHNHFRYARILIMLGFNDMSTFVSHFVLSPGEREKKDRRDSRGDEREGQG